MYTTLYVRQADETFWERGKALAEKRNQSMSTLLSGLLRRELMAEATGDRAEPTPAEMIDDAVETLTAVKAKLAEP